MSWVSKLAVPLVVVSLAACSSRPTDQASATSQPQSHAVSGVTTGSPAPPINDTTPQGGESAGNGGAAASLGNSSAAGGAAPIPSSVSCGTAQPVWVNLRSHAYHDPTDPMYGRTKHGKYMCEQAAIAAGYHKARMRHAAAPAST